MYTDLDQLERHLRCHIHTFHIEFTRLSVFALSSERISTCKAFVAPLLAVVFRAFLRWQWATVEDNVRFDIVVTQ